MEVETDFINNAEYKHYEWNIELCKDCQFLTKIKRKQIICNCKAVKHGENSVIGTEFKGHLVPSLSFFPPEDCPWNLEILMITQGKFDKSKKENLEYLLIENDDLLED